jgi:hypothetical protein
MSARTNIYRAAVLGLLIAHAPRPVRNVLGFMLLGVAILIAVIVIVAALSP